MGIIILYVMVTTAFYTWIFCGAPEGAAKIIGIITLWILGLTLFFLMLYPVHFFEMVSRLFWNP
jgi:hypothetical protein